MAVSCTDAGADAALEPGCDLRDDVGIGDMGAGHRDHVEKAVADCVPRGRDVGDAGGMEHRQADFALEGADLREPGRDGRCHAGHVVGRERRFSVHAPVDRVEKIDVAGVLEHPRDRDGVLEGEAGRIGFVDHVAEAYDEHVSDLPPDLLEHHQPQAAAVLKRAPERIRAPVRLRRQELADEMPAAKHLDAVEPALATALGCRAVRLHHACDVVLVHLLRKAAVQRLADGGGADRRQPVRGIGLTAAAQMRNLAHERRPMGVDALRELLEVWNNLVDADVELPENVRRVGRDVRGAPEHRERDPALGLLLVIELVALLRKTVDLQPGRMARAHNPIFQYQILDLKGLQQGVLAQRGFSLRKRSHRTSDCVN